MTVPFPLRISVMFRRGIVGYARNFLPLTAAAAAPFAVYLAFRVAAINQERFLASIALDLVGMVLAGTVSLPWFSYALDAARDKPIDILGPLGDVVSFVAQLVCSFWFWAAVLLGLRYLFGIPALFAAVFYGFYGYVVADGTAKGGLRALGTSVRLGTGRRVALFAVMALFAVFNFAAALPLGYGVNAVTIASTIAVALVTTSITVVAGACLYDTLYDLMDEQ